MGQQHTTFTQRGERTASDWQQYREYNWIMDNVYEATLEIYDVFKNCCVVERGVFEYVQNSSDKSLLTEWDGKKNWEHTPEWDDFPKKNSGYFINPLKNRGNLHLRQGQEVFNRVAFGGFTGIFVDIMKTIAKYGFDPDFVEGPTYQESYTPPKKGAKASDEEAEESGEEEEPPGLIKNLNLREYLR
jgi:hypothetical protein